MSRNYVNNLRGVFCGLIMLVAAGTSVGVQGKPYVWSKNSAPPVPLELYTQSYLGNTSLIWHRDMKVGYYTLRVKFATGRWRRDFIARVDHREIAFYSGYFTHNGKAKAPEYSFDFVIEQSGRHRIEIDCLVGTFPVHKRSLQVLDISVERRTAPKAPDIFATANPGESYVPLWGWMPSSDFQRRQGWKITGEYWKKRLIDEPAKWGSNYVQLFPDARDNYFQDMDMREAIRYAHNMGFIVDEHAHGGVLLGDSLKTRYENLHKHLKEYFDLLNRSAVYNLDGWEIEQYIWTTGDSNRATQTNKETWQLHFGNEENMIKTNQITWLYHPGATIADCKSEPGEVNNNYMQWLHEGFHGVNYSKYMMCAGGWAYCGYDDMDVMTLFPENLSFKNEYNWVYRGCQGNARAYSPNMWGGSSWIDWIAKEMADFFRLNAFAERQRRPHINSAMAWLGEPEFNLPEQRRHAVYALSMDPCRSALVYRLASTGRDGNLSWRIPLGKQAGHIVPYRPRNWAPCSTVRLHNGILSAEQPAFGDRRRLVWDSENLGQFDLNARTVELTSAFFQTRLIDTDKPVAEHSFKAGSDKSQIWDVKLPVGTYEIQVTAGPAEPFRAELFLVGHYLGSLSVGTKGGSGKFYSFFSDNDTHPIELRLVQGKSVSSVNVKLVPTNYQVPLFGRIGVMDNSSEEFRAAPQRRSDAYRVPVRASYTLGEPAELFPPELACRGQRPQAMDIYFDAEMGCYLLTVRARTAVGDQKVTVSLNSNRFCKEGYRSSGPGYRCGSSANDWIGKPGYKGVINKFVATSQWQTFQIPLVIGHNSGQNKHKLELSIKTGDDPVEFDTIAIYKSPIESKLAMAGGHKAVLKESFKIARDSKKVIENRKLWMVADEPSILMEVERQSCSGSVDVVSTLDYSGYEKMAFDGKNQAKSGSSSKIPRRISFSDTDGLLPPMTVCIIDKGGLKKIKWSKGRIDLAESLCGKQRMVLAATLRTDIGSDFERYLASEPETVNLDLNGKTFTNNDNFTKVHLVKVTNPIKGPYFVEENRWWSVRGAQPLHSSDEDRNKYLKAYDYWITNKDKVSMPTPPYNADLVRLIIPGGGEAKLQPYCFIDGNIRPGLGSQKQMLIKNVKADGCTVKVLSVSAYLYAPRVEFSEPFTDAKVNGRPWAYHDGTNVFLPQKRGDYKIEVVRGANKHPTLHTTSASVESAVYKNNELTVQHELPEYVFKLPEGLNYTYYVAFDSNQTTVDTVEGGKVLRQGLYGAIIEAADKTMSIKFKEPSN